MLFQRVDIFSDIYVENKCILGKVWYADADKVKCINAMLDDLKDYIR